ncbi:MAG: GntR family transcriptional regulator, partial [Actinomycetota bacterium]
MAFPEKSARIEATVRRWLAEGRYAPGARFPSDKDLARRFRVTHVTVRAALKPLVEAGLLERRVGAGTWVRGPGAEARLEPVGLLLTDNGCSFFPELLRGVEGVLSVAQRPLVVAYSGERPACEERVLRSWLEQGIR